MDIQLKKWGNSIGFRIPRKIADSFGIDENSIVELTELGNTLVIRKKEQVPTLDELLTSIPEDFDYPNNVLDFVKTEPLGNEMI